MTLLIALMRDYDPHSVPIRVDGSSITDGFLEFSLK